MARTVEPTVTRAELRSYLGKVGWPLAPALVASFARLHGAPEAFFRVLERMPNRMYMSENDFWGEFQKAC